MKICMFLLSTLNHILELFIYYCNKRTTNNFFNIVNHGEKVQEYWHICFDLFDQINLAGLVFRYTQKLVFKIIIDNGIYFVNYSICIQFFFTLRHLAYSRHDNSTLNTKLNGFVLRI